MCCVPGINNQINELRGDLSCLGFRSTIICLTGTNASDEWLWGRLEYTLSKGRMKDGPTYWENAESRH